MKRLLLLLALCAGVSHAQGFWISQNIQNNRGAAVAGAQITICIGNPSVYAQIPCNNPATLYATPALTGTPLTQPLITDGYGHFGAAAADGLEYTISVIGAGTSPTSYDFTAACVKNGTGCPSGGGSSVTHQIDICTYSGVNCGSVTDSRAAILAALDSPSSVGANFCLGNWAAISGPVWTSNSVTTFSMNCNTGSSAFAFGTKGNEQLGGVGSVLVAINVAGSNGFNIPSSCINSVAADGGVASNAISVVINKTSCPDYIQPPIGTPFEVLGTTQSSAPSGQATADTVYNSGWTFPTTTHEVPFNGDFVAVQTPACSGSPLLCTLVGITFANSLTGTVNYSAASVRFAMLNIPGNTQATYGGTIPQGETLSHIAGEDCTGTNTNPCNPDGTQQTGGFIAIGVTNDVNVDTVYGYGFGPEPVIKVVGIPPNSYVSVPTNEDITIGNVKFEYAGGVRGAGGISELTIDGMNGYTEGMGGICVDLGFTDKLTANGENTITNIGNCNDAFAVLAGQGFNASNVSNIKAEWDPVNAAGDSCKTPNVCYGIFNTGDPYTNCTWRVNPGSVSEDKNNNYTNLTISTGDANSTHTLNMVPIYQPTPAAACGSITTSQAGNKFVNINGLGIATTSCHYTGSNGAGGGDTNCPLFFFGDGLSSTSLLATNFQGWINDVAASQPKGDFLYGTPVGTVCPLGVSSYQCVTVATTGSDPGAKINTAVAALPATGGVVDIRPLGSSGTITTTVSDSAESVEFLFGTQNVTLNTGSSSCGFTMTGPGSSVMGSPNIDPMSGNGGTYFSISSNMSAGFCSEARGQQFKNFYMTTAADTASQVGIDAFSDSGGHTGSFGLDIENVGGCFYEDQNSIQASRTDSASLQPGIVIARYFERGTSGCSSGNGTISLNGSSGNTWGNVTIRDSLTGPLALSYMNTLTLTNDIVNEPNLTNFKTSTINLSHINAATANGLLLNTGSDPTNGFLFGTGFQSFTGMGLDLSGFAGTNQFSGTPTTGFAYGYSSVPGPLSIIWGPLQQSVANSGTTPAGYLAGRAQLASGTVTVTFPVGYTSVPVCTANSNGSTNALEVATTTAHVVITSSSGSDSSFVGWQCMGNGN